jgi:hypothetical protein
MVPLKVVRKEGSREFVVAIKFLNKGLRRWHHVSKLELQKIIANLLKANLGELVKKSAFISIHHTHAAILFW